MLFKRKTSLYVGVFKDGNNPDKSGYLIDGLHYDFLVKKFSEFYKNTARFTIYNANQDTISELVDKGASVIFQAGYENQKTQFGNIFIGQIADAWTDRKPDGTVVTTLLCTAQRGAQYRLSRVYCSFSFPVGTTYYKILQTIADYAGVPLSGASSLRNHKLDSDDGAYADSGNIRDVTANFVRRILRRVGGKVTIDNNEIIYIDTTEKGSTLDTIILTYDTGLISAKVIRNDRQINTEDAFRENYKYFIGDTGQKKASKEQKIPENTQKQIQFKNLITPMLTVNTPVYIDSRISPKDTISYRGKSWINSIEYKGNNYGTGSNNFISTSTSIGR